MPASFALPRFVGVGVVVLALLLGVVPAVPAGAASRPSLELHGERRAVRADLAGFKAGRRARVRLEIGRRTKVRYTRTSGRGRAHVEFRVRPRRPKTVVVTARVGTQRRRTALRYTADGRWVAAATTTTTKRPRTKPPAPDPIEPTPTPDPVEPTPTPDPPAPDPEPEVATPGEPSSTGPFGPDSTYAPPAGVAVAVGELTQALLDAHPEGTTFVVAPGIHRLSSRLRPRSGQQLHGLPGAILDGSKPVTSFTNTGGVWVSGGHNYSYSTHGSCRSGYTACGLTEAVFVDGEPLWQVSTRAELAPGRFLFDRLTGELVLFDDPTGKTVHLTVASAAVAGRRSDGSLANDVVVRNLVIRRFATKAQHGAVNSEGASGWVVERNTIIENSGAGVVADSASIVRSNRINDNGQLGIGGHGEGGLVEGNEIARNHTNGFSIGWEAGGSKWTHTRGLVVRNNYVHDNAGPGLWTDIDNIDTRYEGNVVTANSEAGIFHEISYDVVITGNTISNNGFGNPRWGYGAGIQIAGSPRATITGNVVDRNARGITLIQQSRGIGVYGPHEISDTTVTGNTITMATGFSGMVQDVGDSSYFSTRNNNFSANTYVIATGLTKPFEWRNGTKSAAEWRTFHPTDGPFRTP